VLVGGESKFGSAEDEVISGEGMIEVQNTATRLLLRQPMTTTNPDTIQKCIIRTQSQCCKSQLVHPSLSFDSSRSRLFIYSHSNLVISGSKTDSIIRTRHNV